MFQIEKNGDTVHATFFMLDDYFNPRTYSMEVLHSSSKDYNEFNPKEVLGSFLEQNLDKVLTDEQLPGYPMEKIHEEKTKMFAIEVSTPAAYRFYQYSDPRELGEKFPEANNLYQFLMRYVEY
jgi:hypothetical protein